MAINPVWPFTPQPNKWGYPNNPRWTNTPLAPINYDGRESEEPQVWTLNVQSPRSANGSNQHIPCGHWHRVVPPVVVPASPVFAIIGMNMESGRTVKLGITPFARLSILDYWVSDEYPARCYAISYDYVNGIAYVGINDTDNITTGPYVYIYKVDIATMTVLDRLALSTGSYTKNIEGLCEHPENGFIYALETDNVWASSTLYEIRLSDFTITRQITPSPGFVQIQNNALYPDSTRGYIYYPKNIGPPQTYYTTGTAQTGGTDIVSGFGTTWTGVAVGDIFFMNSVGAWNEIVQIIDNTTIRLAGVYTTAGPATYTIIRVPAVSSYSLRRFNLTTFTDDIVYDVPLIDCIYWGATDNCIYDKTNGKMYIIWATWGFGYYVAHYTLGEIDVDAGTILRTLELPSLPSGYALHPRRFCMSTSHIYILCVNGAPAGNPPPYLATVDLTTFTLTEYPQCLNTTGDGNTIELDSVGGDIKVINSTNTLILYSHAYSTGPANFDLYALYRKYNISGGTPVKTDEVLFDDPDNYEAGDFSSNLVVGQ